MLSSSDTVARVEGDCGDGLVGGQRGHDRLRAPIVGGLNTKWGRTGYLW